MFVLTLLFLLLEFFVTGRGSKCLNCDSINESYRFMIGRNATISECEHFRDVIFTGQQVAYYEPYINKTGNSEYCTSWGGRTSDGLNETITEVHATDITRRGGNDSEVISAILRTVTCELPTDETVYTWTVAYGEILNITNNNATIALPLMASEILKNFNPQFLCWEAMNDVYSRTLGHLPDSTNCDTSKFSNIPPAPNTSDCYWIWALSRGVATIDDVNHHTRSTAEYIEFNEAADCQVLYPLGSKPQTNPHAVGEYVTQIYRIILNRRPTKAEMESIINSYEGGDTKPLLRSLVDKLTAEYC